LPASLLTSSLEKLLPSVAKKARSGATKYHCALARAVVGKGGERSSSRTYVLTLCPMFSVPFPGILKESGIILAPEEEHGFSVVDQAAAHPWFRACVSYARPDGPV